ncbi:MAG: bifunctional 3-(3-hydroxy-phenyl)propionate/3-hydroxycinnamic acid hydroxylase [Rubrivivax sp.]
MQQARSDVVVVGAGPTGLVTALLLARQGHTVAVVERHAAPYPLPRAIGISHESLRILHAAGASEALRDVLFWDERLTSASYVTRSGEVLMQMPFRRRAESGWPEMQCFDQPDFEQALERRVLTQANIRLLRGREVTAVRQDAEGVEVVTARANAGDQAANDARETLQAAYVIGCDGANSIVRQAMGVPVTDLGFTWDWLVVDIQPTVEREWTPFFAQVLSPPRTVTCAPAGPGRRRFEFMLLPGETRDDMGTEAMAWRLLAEQGVDPSNAKLVRNVVYRFRALWADSWRQGRMLLAGDAAHLTPPFIGQGLNSGLRDAATLAWRMDLVLRGLAEADSLDGYTTERVAHVRDLIEQAVGIGRMLCVAEPEACAQRDAALRAMRDTPGAAPPPPVWRLGTGAIAENDPHAGLLGWQGVVRLDGRQGEFDDVCGVGRFVLLGRSGDPRSALAPVAQAIWQRIGGLAFHVGTNASLVDVEGTYAQWFAQTGADVILVRPDFYVFGIGRTLDDASDLVLQLAQCMGPEVRTTTTPTATRTPTPTRGDKAMADISGLWDCIVAGPVSKETHELMLQAAADGSVTGSMKNTLTGHETPIENGRFDGEKLTWTTRLTKPFKLTVTTEVQIEGNHLAGQGGTKMMGTVPITGTKHA